MAQRVTNEQVIAAYKETGSVWKAAKLLGVVGQSVHERLKILKYPLYSAPWTDEEHAEMEALAASGCSIGEIASRLGRPYAGVALKLSRRGIHIGHRKAKKPPKFRYTKAHARKFRKELVAQNVRITTYARQNSLNVDAVVETLQRFEPDFWYEWTRKYGLPDAAECPNCGATFYRLTKKQVTCTRRCSQLSLTDRTYFGGKRNTTVGLSSGLCQLCGREDNHLSSHHLIGKKNDPDNDYLIALCRGCHNVVELLAARTFVDDDSRWEFLISLVLLRRCHDKKRPYAGHHVYVDIEHFTHAQWREMNGGGFDVFGYTPTPHPPKHKNLKPAKLPTPDLLNGLEVH